MNKIYTHCVTFSELQTIEDGMMQRIQILRKGNWDHPTYGKFTIDDAELDEFVQNFKDNTRGVDLCVDVNHDTSHKAIGWFRDVVREGDALFATVEWNQEGVDLINSKSYRYFSPELYFSYRDEES